MVAIFAFTALALDVGMMAIARNQCQNAADAAALAGTRALTGDNSSTSNNNYTGAVNQALTTAANNTILGQAITSGSVSNPTPGQSITVGQVTVNVGSYAYSSSQAAFIISYNSKPAGENWSLVQAKVSSGTLSTTPFAQALGTSLFTVSASATAAHRPRDVAMVLDLSTSMRFASLLGAPWYGVRTQSLNPETVYPTFGHYNGNSSLLYYSGTPTVTAATGEVLEPCNLVTATNDGPAIVDDFYQDTTAYGTSSSAFNNYPTTATPAPNSYATTPGGDNYLPPKGGTAPPYAKTVYDITNASTSSTTKDATWEATNSSGAYTNTAGYGPNFKGYTFGPRYWGKTFFIWPPDPRPANDWRNKFFLTTLGTAFTTVSNTTFWTGSSGSYSWLPPGTTYSINYQAILTWLTSTGPNPFPPQLRSGGVLYYSHIPQPSDSTFSTLNARFWASTTSAPLSDPNERFWKAYIDYVLGVQQSGSTYINRTNTTGYGDDFAWGTEQISAKPTTGNRYMNYGDNPPRPLLHFWFGPMTFLDFTGNPNSWDGNQFYFMWPGTSHEAPMWQLRQSVNAAIRDMQLNHPNDRSALIFFSNPASSSSNLKWNSTVTPLGTGDTHNTLMTNLLYFPSQLVTTPTPELSPFDPSMQNMPVADGGTDWAYGLMLAYNQFSGNSTLTSYGGSPAASGTNGGLGRQGARKLIIFETDGVVNEECSASFTSAGAYNSYYNILQDPSGKNTNQYPTTSPDPGNTIANQNAQTVASQICALTTASPPGYSTATKPVLIHTIAFGSLFDPSNASTTQKNALAGLEQLQYTGGKAGGEQATATTPLAADKLIYGTFQERFNKLQEVFNRIMEDGQQVTLIQ